MARLSSLSRAFFPQCVQHSKSRTETPPISMLRSHSKFKALPTVSFNFRLGNVKNSHGQQRWHVISASNTNPSEQDAPTEQGDGKAQGPPLLTILAGVVVFLFICWVVGSIITWLIGLVLNRPS